jgi:hypothetical protein
MQRRRRFLVGALVCVSLGTYLAFSETNRAAAPWLLVGGIAYAVGYLVLEWRSR